MSVEKSLRIGQGVLFIAGGLFAVVSVRKATVRAKIPTAEAGLGLLTLAFVAAAGTEYTANELRHASLMVHAALAFVIITVDPYSLLAPWRRCSSPG